MTGRAGVARLGYLRRMPVLDSPAWMAAAVCAQPGADASLWFPADDDAAGELAAVVACQGCPVRVLCLDRAVSLRELDHGVFGGLGPVQRRALARELAA